MKDLSWRVIKHSELAEQDKIHICELKDQHWKHGLTSQLNWLQVNVDSEDFHLLGEEDTKRESVLRAYLSLVNVSVEFDGLQTECIGLGSVCVDKSFEHRGLGRNLVLKANEYIESQKRKGILLCKQNLVGFYNKCEWNLVSAKEIYVEKSCFEHQIMIYPSVCLIEVDKIVVNKNF